MQGDLISRSALLEELKDFADSHVLNIYDTAYDVVQECIATVENQETAYNVENVVAELEKIYDRIDKEKKEAYEDEDWELFDLFMHRNEGIYIALTIVHNGGKEYIWRD